MTICAYWSRFNVTTLSRKYKNAGLMVMIDNLCVKAEQTQPIDAVMGTPLSIIQMMNESLIEVTKQKRRK